MSSEFKCATIDDVTCVTIDDVAQYHLQDNNFDFDWQLSVHLSDNFLEEGINQAAYAEEVRQFEELQQIAQTISWKFDTLGKIDVKAASYSSINSALNEIVNTIRTRSVSVKALSSHATHYHPIWTIFANLPHNDHILNLKLFEAIFKEISYFIPDPHCPEQPFEVITNGTLLSTFVARCDALFFSTKKNFPVPYNLVEDQMVLLISCYTTLLMCINHNRFKYMDKIIDSGVFEFLTKLLTLDPKPFNLKLWANKPPAYELLEQFILPLVGDGHVTTSKIKPIITYITTFRPLLQNDLLSKKPQLQTQVKPFVKLIIDTICLLLGQQPQYIRYPAGIIKTDERNGIPNADVSSLDLQILIKNDVLTFLDFALTSTPSAKKLVFPSDLFGFTQWFKAGSNDFITLLFQECPKALNCYIEANHFLHSPSTEASWAWLTIIGQISSLSNEQLIIQYVLNPTTLKCILDISGRKNAPKDFNRDQWEVALVVQTLFTNLCHSSHDTVSIAETLNPFFQSKDFLKSVPSLVPILSKLTAGAKHIKFGAVE